MAEAIGESLEDVWRMSDVERRQLIEVLGIGQVARPVLEEEVGLGGHGNTVGDDTRGVGQGAGYKEQKCEDQVELEEASVETKDEEEPPNDVFKVGWASSVEKQLNEDAAKVARLLVGTRNEGMGGEQLEAYLQAHMDNPNRVKVVVEELTGVDAQAEEDTPLLHIDAEANEEVYQGKGKGLGKGKSNTLKRGLADIAEGEHRGEDVVESRENKQRKLDDSAVAEKENSKENVVSPRLIGKVEVVGDPMEAVFGERLLVEFADVQKDSDTDNPGPGPSGVSNHPGELVQQNHLKLKDIRQLVGDPKERRIEQEHEAVSGKNVEAVDQNDGGEAVNPGVNMEVQQAENFQAPANLDEAVVIIDPRLNQDGGEEDEQMLLLLRKQLAPGRDRVYSPEVRGLAESLAEMFPNTPLSYLLQRCTLQFQSQS